MLWISASLRDRKGHYHIISKRISNVDNSTESQEGYFVFKKWVGGGAFWHVTFFVDEKPMCVEATVTNLGKC